MRCNATQRNSRRFSPAQYDPGCPRRLHLRRRHGPAIASASVTAARAAGRLDALRRIRCNACRPRADRCARRHAYETPFLYTRAAML
ncbi:conserved hypothetical protein [Burkholderia pseudomallei 576]|nr:conserved hypothetical protein [Burkholderia pseudomallei 576]PJO54582.1 hypothetical protein CWD85_37055 [Burkholderia pseudomallei]